MEKDYKFHLQKYRSRADRHICPSCGQREFTYYVDENEQPLSEECGKCNRVNNCGYHYTPKMYFADHPDHKPQQSIYKPVPKPIAPPKPLCTIPFEYVVKSAFLDNTFIEYLAMIAEPDALQYACNQFIIGTTKSRSIIFWQIDIKGRCRTGKIIPYKLNGHRDKSKNVNWCHSLLQSKGLLPQEWELSQCLFGEHQINYSYNKGKTIALVEAEKTALVGTIKYPQYVWVATGSRQNLKPELLKVLTGKKVIVFPDADANEEWTEKIKRFTFAKFVVNDIVAKNEPQGSTADLADWLLLEMENEQAEAEATPFAQMMRTNEAFRLLVNKFDLIEI
ncbi:MAG: hypothetical protein J6T52_02440 [Bacteroidaceae bacterium]|nr:hypothetical protein [Bacteroidaceae bacterium]